MRHVSDKSYRENQNGHFILSKFFRNLAVCEIMWGRVEQEGAAVNIINSEPHCMLDN